MAEPESRLPIAFRDEKPLSSARIARALRSYHTIRERPTHVGFPETGLSAFADVCGLYSNRWTKQEKTLMRILREGTLGEYSAQFWDREEGKNPNHPALDSIRQGSDPTEMLRSFHPYKLPRAENRMIQVALLNEDEVGNLLIHEYMMNDRWMRERKIQVERGRRNLNDLAMAFLEQGYFDRGCDDTQIKCYKKWKEENSLDGRITGLNRTFIEQVNTDMYEIVDGWGRLLPYVALVEERLEFHPVETFVARSD